MRTIRMLVRGPLDSARDEAKANGIDVDVVRARTPGDLVLAAYLSDYELVRLWWMRGLRLIRTLGPDER